MSIYVKIVGRDSNKETRNRVFATNFLSFKKRNADCYSTFVKESRGVSISNFPIEHAFEYLEIEYTDPDTKLEKIISAPESSVYLLNINGRTIDSMHCESQK